MGECDIDSSTVAVDMVPVLFMQVLGQPDLWLHVMS